MDHEEFYQKLEKAKEIQAKGANDDGLFRYKQLRKAQKDLNEIIKNEFFGSDITDCVKAFRQTLDLDYISDAFCIGKTRFHDFPFHIDFALYPFTETNLMQKFFERNKLSGDQNKVAQAIFNAPKSIYKVVKTDINTGICTVRDVLAHTPIEIYDQGMSITLQDRKEPIFFISYLLVVDNITFMDCARIIEGERRIRRLIPDYIEKPSLFNSIYYGLYFKEQLNEKKHNKRKK